MPYAVVAEKLKTLNAAYLQEAFNYIVYLASKQNAAPQENTDLSRSEAIAIFKSFAGSLPQDFDAQKERDSYFMEKYGDIR